MPANIQIFAQELNDVVNFKLIPPEIVHQVVINVVGEQARNKAPLNMTDALNSTDSQRILEETSSIEESLSPLDADSIISKLAIVIAAALFLALLIVFICICNYKISKCCKCFQKIFLYLKGKLMYGALLRTILIMYLGSMHAICAAFEAFDSTTTLGIVQTGVTILVFCLLTFFPVFTMQKVVKN